MESENTTDALLLKQERKATELERKYPGIFTLQALPEVYSMKVEEKAEGCLAVLVVSKDGYNISYALRQASEDDFNGKAFLINEARQNNDLVIQDMTIQKGDASIDVMAGIKKTEEKHLDGKKITLVIRTKKNRAEMLPNELRSAEEYRPTTNIDDSIARTMVVWSDKKHKSGHANPELYYLGMFLPVGDLSLAIFGHEIGHLFDPEYKERLKKIGEYTQEEGQYNDQIAKLNERLNTHKQKVFRAASPNEPDEITLKAIEKQQEKHYQIHERLMELMSHRFKYQNKTNIIAERNAHAILSSILRDYAKRLSSPREQLERFQTFIKYTLYTKQKALDRQRSDWQDRPQLLAELPETNFIKLGDEEKRFFSGIYQRISEIEESFQSSGQ